MLKLLEWGMLLRQSGKWYFRIWGSLLMIPPILKAKWVEMRMSGGAK